MVDLEVDLAKSEKIKTLVQDMDYACALYAALCNIIWVKDGEEYTVSWRSAGDVLAELRGQNEDYIDFYCRGNEGFVRPDVAKDLAELGWTYKEYPELDRN